MSRNESGWRSRDAVIGGVLLLALCGVNLSERFGRRLNRLPAGPSFSAISVASAEETKPAVPETAGPNFDRDIKPVLQKFCIDCHGPEKKRAGLALHTFTNEQMVIEGRKTWEKVVHLARTREMPPANRPQPTEAERILLINWVEGVLSRIDCDLAHDPGRVTIRRLNRVEYNNTIRDLIGVDFQPADDFPSDDVGYGFDNIGDVLSLPTLLLEKYLSAAERIGAAAIVVDDPVNGPLTKYTAQELDAKGGAGNYGDGARNLNSSALLSKDFQLPKGGEYVLRARAFGQQAGDEPAKMAFQVDGKSVHVADVKAVVEEPAVYSFRMKLEEGTRRIGVAFINDFYNPKDPDPKNRDRNLIIYNLEVQGPIDESALQRPESHRRIVTRRPQGDLSDLDETCQEVLGNLLKRAWRRPVTAEEVAPYVALAKMVMNDGETYEKGIEIALEAILVSPQFLFRLEQDHLPQDPAQANTVHEVNEFELATRLSYFLWSSMPDEELFGLAERGELRKEGVLDAQVQRMLQDPKSRSLVDNFAGQWLQLRNLKTFSPDPDLFPTFDDPLRDAMIRETELFFAALLREDRSILDFLDADFTFLNERLAKHYGIPNVSGDEFQRVQLKGDQRGGILTQASILTVTSNPTRTSPVKRGKWVLDNLLGTPPPPPPPGVEELSEEKNVVLSGSLRQRMEQHRSKPGCATCHQRMDPLGFGLENFDAIGSWRTQDGNFDIDPSGELPSGESFKTPRELKSILKNMRAEFTACLSEKMLTYALGRGLEYYDKCALDDITRAMAEKNYRFSVLIREIVHSDPFQKRRGKRGEQ